jgi:hypothetical protein
MARHPALLTDETCLDLGHDVPASPTTAARLRV